MHDNTDTHSYIHSYIHIDTYTIRDIDFDIHTQQSWKHTHSIAHIYECNMCVCVIATIG